MERTEALARLGISHPVLQAPMAGVSTPALAAAVSNAGGLGALGLGACDVQEARAMIHALRARTQAPFNVNFFAHRPPVPDPAREAAWCDALRPYFAQFGAAPPVRLRRLYRSFAEDPQMLAMVLEEKPAVVSLHFGLPPAPVIAALRAAGIVLLASATSLAEARQIAAAGIDMIVAQGIEAGGHRGVFAPERADEGLGTLALTRLCVRHCDVPVIAAGGIMDGAGIGAALRLGAVAAQLGTAFIGCPESAADPAYRAALEAVREGGAVCEPPACETGTAHTVLTDLISGRPARVLANRFSDLARPLAGQRPAAYPLAYDAGKALHAAASARGVSGFGAYWAGQGAPLARALPAATLVARLLQELRAAPA
ncbi:nitronate monooxygenase [Thioclava sp. GXIMD4216]|uniref:NAD(P)H-dependent flavin oxidoreductase n=1 Tax=Thioclava sp. GXIMD4216 TaxID=3131929 RepID=UPI0030D1D6E3